MRDRGFQSGHCHLTFGILVLTVAQHLRFTT